MGVPPWNSDENRRLEYLVGNRTIMRKSQWSSWREIADAMNLNDNKPRVYTANSCFKHFDWQRKSRRRRPWTTAETKLLLTLSDEKNLRDTELYNKFEEYRLKDQSGEIHPRSEKALNTKYYNLKGGRQARAGAVQPEVMGNCNGSDSSQSASDEEDAEPRTVQREASSENPSADFNKGLNDLQNSSSPRRPARGQGEVPCFSEVSCSMPQLVQKSRQHTRENTKNLDFPLPSLQDIASRSRIETATDGSRLPSPYLATPSFYTQQGGLTSGHDPMFSHAPNYDPTPGETSLDNEGLSTSRLSRASIPQGFHLNDQNTLVFHALAQSPFIPAERKLRRMKAFT